jgi:hypothetical protein
LRSEAPLGRATLLGIESVLATDAAFAARVETLAAAPSFEWVGVFRALRAYRPDRAKQLAERTTRLAAPGPGLTLGVGGLTGLLLAAGDARAADSLAMGTAVLSTPAGAVRHAQRMVAAALIGAEDSSSTARAVRVLSEHVPLDSALSYFDARPVWTVSWSLGTWHAQRGDTALARRWLAMLARFRPGGSPAMWREAIAADIASRLAERRGDADSARVHAARAFELWSIHTENTTDADVEPALRFRHARLLIDAGMKDSAARILRSFIPPTSWIGSYVPQAHLLLARIAEERGERDVAARHYAEATQLLALGGDPAFALRAAADSGNQRLSAVRLYRYGREP